MDADGSGHPVTSAAAPASRRRWAIAAIGFWLAMVGWAIASPVLSSPDENVHVALLACQANKANCDREEEPREYPCFAFRPDTTADCLPGTVPLSTAGVETGRYPGLYATALRPLVSDSVEGTVLRVRLFNATLALVVMLLSLKATREVIRPAVAVSFVVGLLPLGLFLIPSVNPSSWAIVGAAALWGPLFSLSQDGFRWVRAVAVSVAFLMLVGSRNEGWVIAAAIAGAALLAVRPAARRWSAPVVVLALSAMIAVFRTNPALEPGPVVGSRGAWEQLLMALSTPGDVFGATALFPAPLGWLDTPLPAVVGLLAYGSAAGLGMLGLGVMDARKARVVLGFGVVSGVLVLLGWVTLFPSALQPRIALPLAIVALGLLLLPARHHPVTLSRTQAVVLGVALSVGNTLALLALTLRFAVAPAADTTIEPSADYPGPLDLLDVGAVDWTLTPVSPFLAWLLASVAFAVFVAAVLSSRQVLAAGQPEVVAAEGA